MPFGIGGSRSRSSSSSQSSSFDNLDSSSFNIGGSGSTSSSTGVSSSADRIAFEELFQNLFSGASAAAGGINTQGLSGAANQLFSSGGDFLENLGGGGPGGEFLEGELADSDRLADEQIDLLGSDINRFLTENVLPGINQTGISAGTFGGSRGEVARGIAGEGAVQEFARGSTAIRTNERARTDSIATALLQENTQASQAGLSGLAEVFGLAESAAFADLSPFAQLSSILGDPTVLNDSASISEALAESFGFDVGASRTRGRAGSESASTSSSRSRSFSLSGLGG